MASRSTGCGCSDGVSLEADGISPEFAHIVDAVVREVMASMVPRQEGLIPVGISARHLHITQEHLEELFGAGHQLTRLRELNQPGEFAAEETVTVIGPKRRLFERVRILGPVRSITQVEMSRTDGIYLGLDLPHRLSGNIRASAPVVLMGPRGVLHLPEGVIRAQRHIHVCPELGKKLGLRNGQVVSVRTRGDMSITFNNVVVREGENLKLEMHVDTDEANAAGLSSADFVE